MAAKNLFSLMDARQIGDTLGIDWQVFGVEQFLLGLVVEFAPDAKDAHTNVSNYDALMTGKLAWAHLKEYPDYYTYLSAMEKDADEYWANV
jgi:hypothetical protein